MTGLNHALTGAVVAIAINRPLLSLPAAFASHFITDALPHWDYKIRGHHRLRQVIIGLDMGMSLVLLGLLSYVLELDPRLLFLGGLLAILPDMMWFPYILFSRPSPVDRQNLLHRLRRFHFKIQWSESAPGLILEVAWFMTFLFIIVYLGN